MGRPNYSFKKRQKELARKKKKEQKRQAKLDKKAETLEENITQPQDEGENAGGTEPDATPSDSA